MKNTKKQESGRSMVEMVGVLAIMGLITAAAFVLLNSGYKSQKRSQAADEIDVIVSNVRAMAAQAEDKSSKFSALPADDDDGLKKGEALAKALLASSDGATPFGGTYAVVQAQAGAAFQVKMIDVNDECEAMASRKYTHGNGNCADNTVTITFSE